MTPTIEPIDLPLTKGLAIRATLPLAELPTFFGPAYEELQWAATSGGAQCIGPPFARYLSFGSSEVEVEAVVPLDRSVPAIGRAYPVMLPSGPALQVVHKGSYDTLGSAYLALDHYARDHRLKLGGVVREVYLDDPSMQPDPDELRTVVIQPVA